MLETLKDALTGELDAGRFTDMLNRKLDLPDVYRAELVHAGSGRKVHDSLSLKSPEAIDYDALVTVKDVSKAVEQAFPGQALSARLVSPTDPDGVSPQFHLHTLRGPA